MKRLSWLMVLVAAYVLCADTAWAAKRRARKARKSAAPAPVKPAAPAPRKPVEIPIPQGAQLKMELDLTDQDILGMVKGLLEGAQVKMPIGQPSKSDEKKELKPEGQMQTIDLSKILSGLREVRLLIYNAPKGGGRATLDHYVDFYEKPFAQQGGRRVFWLGEEKQRILVMWFTKPVSLFFVLVQEGEKGLEVVAARTDGMINLQELAPLVAAMMSSGKMGEIGMEMEAEGERKEKQ